jgi:hypothetical protein
MFTKSLVVFSGFLALICLFVFMTHAEEPVYFQETIVQDSSTVNADTLCMLKTGVRQAQRKCDSLMMSIGLDKVTYYRSIRDLALSRARLYQFLAKDPGQNPTAYLAENRFHGMAKVYTAMIDKIE